MRGSTMKHLRIPHWGYIFTTVVLAALLSVIPLPKSIQAFWPDWFNLIVFYWVLVLPLHLGVTFGWLLGLVEDIISFSLLGQHALGKALTGMVAGIFSRKFYLFNVVEKILFMFVLQVINIGIVSIVNLLALDMPVRLSMWQPAISTALVWPIVAFLLHQFDPNT